MTNKAPEVSDGVVELSVDFMMRVLETSKNIPGRFRKKRVDEIMRLVNEGHWYPRISVVMFYPDMQLADAFHRMHAHILLGLPMRTRVLYNCTREEVAAVDQHLRRSAAVQGQVLGKQTTLLPLAVALEYGLATNTSVDNFKKIELREKYIDVIEFMLGAFVKIKSFPVAAQLAVAHEYIRIKNNPSAVSRLKDFGIILRTNNPKEIPQYTSALELYKYLNTTKFADNTKREECMNKTIKCMRKFMRPIK